MTNFRRYLMGLANGEADATRGTLLMIVVVVVLTALAMTI